MVIGKGHRHLQTSVCQTLWFRGLLQHYASNKSTRNTIKNLKRNITPLHLNILLRRTDPTGDAKNPPNPRPTRPPPRHPPPHSNIPRPLNFPPKPPLNPPNPCNLPLSIRRSPAHHCCLIGPSFATDNSTRDRIRSFRGHTSTCESSGIQCPRIGDWSGEGCEWGVENYEGRGLLCCWRG